MKIVLIAIVAFLSCNTKPDFVKNGVAYKIEETCVKDHIESRYEYHFGLNYMNGKLEWHLGPNAVVVCDSTRIDTVKIDL